MKNEVILVNELNQEIGSEEKIKAHKEGKLHRAFSIFIFNSKGQLMIQQRAKAKYHSGGLWSNTCCSHPRPKEKTEDAAKRRLEEEMGFVCDLKEIFSFTYKAKIGNLIEHEFNHVFIGQYDDVASLNRDEANDWKWIDLKELKKDISTNPNKYTVWFKIAIKRVGKYLRNKRI